MSLLLLIVMLFTLSYAAKTKRRNAYNYTVGEVSDLLPWHFPITRTNKNSDMAARLLFSHYLFRRKGMQQIFDGFPYFYRNPQTKQEAIFCLVEKVGSTEWKSLLLKSLAPEFFKTNITSSSGNSHSYTDTLPVYYFDEFVKKMDDPKVPRILLVRNPYNKILSGWLDKVDPIFYKGFNRSDGFESFTQHLFDNRFDLSAINDHFHPITSKCLGHFIKYDYRLKVEEMDYWYTPLIKKLGLEIESSSGWNYSNTIHNSTKPCFFTPADETCDTLFQKRSYIDCAHMLKVRNIYMQRTTMNTTFESGHTTNSKTKLARYYSEKAIQNINSYADADFSSFRYDKSLDRNLTSYAAKSLQFGCALRKST